MNWEYYNQLVHMFSPIHSYIWTLFNSSSSNIEQLLLLGGLSLFTPSQLAINTILVGIIFLRILRDHNWVKFAFILCLVRFISLFGGFIINSSLDSSISNFLIGILNPVSGPFLFLFILFVLLSKELSLLNFGLWTLGVITVLSLHKDPMIISISNLLIGEVSLSTFPIIIGIYYFVLVTPLLLLLIILYAFDIDLKICNNESLKRGTFLITGTTMLLVSINEMILYWSF
jgi:hypothetical protein